RHRRRRDAGVPRPHNAGGSQGRWTCGEGRRREHAAKSAGDPYGAAAAEGIVSSGAQASVPKLVSRETARIAAVRGDVLLDDHVQQVAAFRLGNDDCQGNEERELSLARADLSHFCLESGAAALPPSKPMKAPAVRVKTCSRALKRRSATFGIGSGKLA